ncbi:MAG: hypothetical protein ACJA0R_001654 [Zhongshania aliphaticivorans]|jgi:hypothetical protein
MAAGTVDTAVAIIKLAIGKVANEALGAKLLPSKPLTNTINDEVAIHRELTIAIK